MKIFTFCGNCKYLDELDFDYVIVDKTYNDITPEQVEKYKDKIIWNETNSNDRQTRIAKNILKALEIAKNLNDDKFAILDSDIIMPRVRQILAISLILTPCYPLYYDWADEIRPFCSGTNYIFSKQHINILENVFLQFINNRDKITEKVDIFVHDRIPHLNAFIPPVSHYIKGEKVTYTIGNLNLIRKHIPELVLVF
ncbi:hypothetical protein QIT30_gp26 [Saccharolobus solfataricus rod-shaped virus 1]|uniref:Uncharacterized protein n=1 Tax=Saccharolobus solfataricus rod-shaped virus 1 TaxID=2730619 RepID=A0A6M3VYI2_SSRV1|nr:hypothetical protein QIT30_gp26 [Saccharolobus solfataricus rod-shaped virus 1]QJF12302.1 hypothetical protein SSRV1_gp26 [Saccharolobus solfataricus rod-shaped virus 1]